MENNYLSYALINKRIYRVADGCRILSSDDEYWTALEWLTERGWI